MALMEEEFSCRRRWVTSERFSEIGEVLNGSRPGRRGPEDITLYRSLGVAAQDLASALAILAMAEKAGRGVSVDWS